MNDITRDVRSSMDTQEVPIQAIVFENFSKAWQLQSNFAFIQDSEFLGMKSGSYVKDLASRLRPGTQVQGFFHCLESRGSGSVSGLEKGQNVSE